MWNPWDELDGAQVVYGPCPINGLYWPAGQAILIREGLPAATERSVLAEEIAHHRLGHRPHHDRAEVDRMELRARRWAAVRLITLDDLVAAMRGADSFFEVVEELGVDSELLEVRVRWLSDEELEELEWAITREELRSRAW